MKRHYSVDDFVGGSYVGVNETKQEFVNKKLSLLRDFQILKPNDNRLSLVEGVLKQCDNEHQMSIVIHDLLVGRTTLDEMLTRKGLM